VLGENRSSEVRTRPVTVSYVPNGWTTTEQFEDEIHPRLRFAHRGLVAMANNGKKNSNDSQFIITLGAVKSYFMYAIVPNSVSE
jgi:cyclophilin family peptidyl-prolyl cis-trans isomerase